MVTLIAAWILSIAVTALAVILYTDRKQRGRDAELAQARTALASADQALRVHGQIITALTLRAAGKTKVPVRLPKATLEQAAAWTVHGKPREDGGLDLTLVEAVRAP